ncbi:MAG: hypothetical protein L6R37_001101 [Teloschistes peruensis]|nr:MAG: hypothetical protein L6R37_001101 [Teloschistes peruensis]
MTSARLPDFESAADHTLTLQKWQEIGLPLSMPVKQKGGRLSKHNDILNTRATPATSVFEPAYDNTEKPAHDSNAMRWKFRGPWIAGKTEGDFIQYLEKHVRQRKLDFRTFVRHRLAHTRTLRQIRIAQENGEVMDIQVNVTEQDVDLYLKELRQDQEQLQKLIEEFLDLPMASDPNLKKSTSSKEGTSLKESTSSKENTSVFMMDSDKGPPRTHLAAGLSYLRTASHMMNHPVLGPMEEEPPVQARILRPQRSHARLQYPCALLGVGGVAADDDTKHTTYRSPTENRGVERFDAATEGGTKVWVRPDRASVDSHGRLRVHVVRAGAEDLATYEGIVPEQTPSPSRRRDYGTIMPKLEFRRTTSSKASQYGLGEVGDALAGQASRRIQPLDTGSDRSQKSTQRFMDLVPESGNR